MLIRKRAQSICRSSPAPVKPLERLSAESAGSFVFQDARQLLQLARHARPISQHALFRRTIPRPNASSPAARSALLRLPSRLYTCFAGAPAIWRSSRRLGLRCSFFAHTRIAFTTSSFVMIVLAVSCFWESLGKQKSHRFGWLVKGPLTENLIFWAKRTTRGLNTRAKG